MYDLEPCGVAYADKNNVYRTLTITKTTEHCVRSRLIKKSHQISTEFVGSGVKLTMLATSLLLRVVSGILSSK